MENEVWVDIIGHEGLCQVSNKSRFRTLDRIVNSGYGCTRIEKGKILKKRINTNGYYQIGLSKGGVKKLFLTHRLIAIHFIPNINNLPIVEHKDDNPLNDSIDNLMWSTYSNNTINAHYRNSKANQVKPIIQYDLNGNFISNHISASEAQRLFTPGRSCSGIRDCLTGRNKTAYSFIWKYKTETL